MNNKKEVISEIINDIKPGRIQEIQLQKKINTFSKKIMQHRKDIEIFIGGSYAKDTYLKNIKDIDVFFCFDYEDYKNKDISEETNSILNHFFADIKKLHGSRDYFQINFNNIIFEIIPILKIKDSKKAKNITDISPLHVDFVKKYPNYSDDIRLAKAFTKANRIYGAESYIKGFSGYCLEILVIHYKGFLNFLKNTSKWKEKTLIDPKNHHNDIIKEMNKSKITGPLILVDPVEKGRNVASSLSEKNYNILIKKAKDFLKKPSKEYFRKQKIDINYLKNIAKKDNLIILEIENESGKEDIEGCKLLNVYERIKKEIELDEFKIKNSGWDWDKKLKTIMWFIIKKEKRTKDYIKEGPPIKSKNHSKAFKLKHKETFIKNNKLYAIEKRKYMDAKELIKDMINKFKDKVKKIEIK
jgi:tRNA nucleotidyltransferase (CCA-adding enzyme)